MDIFDFFALPQQRKTKLYKERCAIVNDSLVNDMFRSYSNFKKVLGLSEFDSPYKIVNWYFYMSPWKTGNFVSFNVDLGTCRIPFRITYNTDYVAKMQLAIDLNSGYEVTIFKKGSDVFDSREEYGNLEYSLNTNMYEYGGNIKKFFDLFYNISKNAREVCEYVAELIENGTYEAICSMIMGTKIIRGKNTNYTELIPFQSAVSALYNLNIVLKNYTDRTYTLEDVAYFWYWCMKIDAFKYANVLFARLAFNDISCFEDPMHVVKIVNDTIDTCKKYITRPTWATIMQAAYIEYYEKAAEIAKEVREKYGLSEDEDFKKFFDPNNTSAQFRHVAPPEHLKNTYR